MLSKFDCKTVLNNEEIVINYPKNIQNLDGKKIASASLSHNKASEASEASETIEQGLDFMLSHFPEPLFPRMVSTVATRDGQKVVYDRNRVLLFCQGALFRQDCKIACYPNYEEMKKKGLIPLDFRPKPDHIFIDMDLKDFGGDKHKLDLALKKTLQNISRHLGGAIPIVLWSGGGYHIHQPLDPDVIPVYEDLQEFKRYKDPSVQFMRYAALVLTGGKCDHNHRISFSSCMARIPGSRNSKYQGEDAEVKIMQKWNSVRASVSPKFALTDFLIWLVQADLDARERMRKQAQKFKPAFFFSSRIREKADSSIAWIDHLLLTPIPDWRKTAVALVLAPYLITIKRMSYEQAYYTIMQWAARCAQLSALRPNEYGFVDRVHISLDRSLNKQSKPLRYVTLVNDYAGLYETLKLSGGV